MMEEEIDRQIERQRKMIMVFSLHSAPRSHAHRYSVQCFNGFYSWSIAKYISRHSDVFPIPKIRTQRFVFVCVLLAICFCLVIHSKLSAINSFDGRTVHQHTAKPTRQCTMHSNCSTQISQRFG